MRVGAGGGGPRRGRRRCCAARRPRWRRRASREPPRIGAGQRPHRARVARHGRPRRANRSWPASRRGSSRSRSSRRRAPNTATPRAPCSPRPMARWASRAPSPTTSKSSRLRARGRSLPRRPAAARRRREHGARGRRSSAAPRAARRPLRLPHRAAAWPARTRIRLPSRSRDRSDAGMIRAVVGGQRDRAVRRRNSRRDRRGVDRATYEQAAAASRDTRLPVATSAGDCSAGRTWSPAAARDEARGILETKRDIKDLRDADRRGAGGARPADGGDRRVREGDRPGDAARLPRSTPSSTSRRRRSSAYDAQLQRAAEELHRLSRKRSSWRASAARPRKSARRSTAARPRRARRSPGSMAISARPTSG